jgi:hypothetical protein
MHPWLGGYLALAAQNCALKCIATAAEGAAAILYLSSPEWSFVNGIALPVDEGRLFHCFTRKGATARNIRRPAAVLCSDRPFHATPGAPALSCEVAGQYGTRTRACPPETRIPTFLSLRTIHPWPSGARARDLDAEAPLPPALPCRAYGFLEVTTKGYRRVGRFQAGWCGSQRGGR